MTWAAINFPASSTRQAVGQKSLLFAENEIGNSGRFWRTHFSSDGGQTWPINSSDSTLHDFVETSGGALLCRKFVSPFFAPSPQQVLRSEDGGASWAVVVDSFFGDFYTALETFENDGVVLRESYFGRRFSSDGGKTWSQLNKLRADADLFLTSKGTWLSFTYASELVRIDSTGIADTIPCNCSNNPKVFEFEKGQIFRADHFIAKQQTSFDDGLTWQNLGYPNLSALGQAAVIPKKTRTTDGKIFGFSSVLRGLHMTQNFGASWHFSSFGVQRGGIDALVALGGDSLLIANTSGLWLKPNATEAWRLVKEKTVPPFNFNARVMADSLGHIYFNENFNLYRTNSSFQAFQNISPAGEIVIRFFHLPLASALIVETQFPQKGKISHDFGVTWQDLELPEHLTGQFFQHPSGDILCSLTPLSLAQYHNFRSQDQGATWSEMLSWPPDLELYHCSPSGDLIAGTLKSIDYGQTWESLPGIFPWSFNALNHYFSRNGIDVSRSTDGGWIYQTLPQNGMPNETSPFIDRKGFLYLASTDALSINAPDTLTFFVRTRASTLNGAHLLGALEKDADGDCATLAASDSLQNWIVEAQKGSDLWFSKTDAAGRYSMFLDTGSYEVRVRRPLKQLFWEVCEDSIDVVLPDVLDTAFVDFRALALSDCPFLGVDLAIPTVVPCFSSPGAVAFTNFGTAAADSAFVLLTLDPLARLVASSLPADSLGGGVWRFSLGSVAAGEGGEIQFSILADCDSTALGQALCFAAQGLPDSICGGPSAAWSGAEVRVSARCVNDTAAEFRVKNLRPIGSQPLEYIIVEDDVVLKTGQNGFAPLEEKTMTVSMPEGRFVRLVSEQEPGHPLEKFAADWTINCGGPTISAFPTAFLLDFGAVSRDRECLQAVGSFDPNDKKAAPEGFGPDRLIEPNGEIEYVIRFQNTGTAPAHFVVVRDTLSPFLDAGSLRVGAASHPFSWKMDGKGALAFRFDPIDLPDSSANEAASHGFVSFRVAQKPDLAIGTVILNRAAIYFDYNLPIITNQTRHQVGQNFLQIVAVESPDAPAPSLRFWPNPLGAEAVLTFEKLSEKGQNRLFLIDLAGKTALEQAFSGQAVRLKKGDLAAGVFLFEVKNEKGELLAAGKLAVAE